MNIYLVICDGWVVDYYRGVVVAADSEEEALTMHPRGHVGQQWPKEGMTVSLLGKADPTIVKGIILERYEYG